MKNFSTMDFNQMKKEMKKNCLYAERDFILMQKKLETISPLNVNYLKQRQITILYFQNYKFQFYKAYIKNRDYSTLFLFEEEYLSFEKLLANGLMKRLNEGMEDVIEAEVLHISDEKIEDDSDELNQFFKQPHLVFTTKTRHKLFSESMKK